MKDAGIPPIKQLTLTNADMKDPYARILIKHKLLKEEAKKGAIKDD